jgi:hypothetical protein
MNETSRWRLEVARYVADIVAKHPGVAAVMLGGSASRGNADAYSDIEIGVFWSEPPTEADRMAPIEPAGGVFWELDPFDPRDSSWMEEWGLGGVKMDMRNLTVNGVETILQDVLENSDTGRLKQVLLSAIQYGIPLVNEPLVNVWKEKIAVYPRSLAEAAIREYLHLDEWCWWVELLASRGDITLVYSAFSECSHQILFMLMGLNRIYNPGFKWLNRLIDEMTIKPEHLNERISAAFRAEPMTGLAILRDLMLETYHLVDTHMPEIDTTEARNRFLRLRPQFAEMPDSLVQRIQNR